LPKYSGYKLIGDLLADESFLSSKLLLIDPDHEASGTNTRYLTELGVPTDRIVSYVAPIYSKTGPLLDDILNTLIQSEKPDNILINLGGMTQERLGAGIKRAVTHDCQVYCTGAAIAFYTGQQAPVSKTIDRLYLGWLWRCFHSPRMYIPRYVQSIKLVCISSIR
jgi:hypothetical protein